MSSTLRTAVCGSSKRFSSLDKNKISWRAITATEPSSLSICKCIANEYRHCGIVSVTRVPHDPWLFLQHVIILVVVCQQHRKTTQTPYQNNGLTSRHEPILYHKTIWDLILTKTLSKTMDWHPKLTNPLQNHRSYICRCRCGLKNIMFIARNATHDWISIQFTMSRVMLESQTVVFLREIWPWPMFH